MIEILLLIALCRAIGRQLRAKGRRAGFYQFLTVILWVGGEVTGIVAGMSLDLGYWMYVLGYTGAACGAGTAYAIATLVRPAWSASAVVGPVFD